MSEWMTTRCTAFNGLVCVAAGELQDVAVAAKGVVDSDREASLLIFNDATSESIEVDFRGTSEDVLRRLAERNVETTPAAEFISTEREGPQGPGRPKLGVVAREVTLLPRHWEWLNTQSGGASVALRKLVEDARRSSADKDRARQIQEATYRFMSAMAGDLPGFEEAARALFAGDPHRLGDLIAEWPIDIRDHVMRLAL